MQKVFKQTESLKIFSSPLRRNRWINHQHIIKRRWKITSSNNDFDERKDKRTIHNDFCGQTKIFFGGREIKILYIFSEIIYHLKNYLNIKSLGKLSIIQ